jgi:hypothetical protein
MGIKSWVTMLMITIFIGTVIANEFQIIMEDEKTSDKSEDFNSTIDSVISMTWTTFHFIPVGIIVVGAAWVGQRAGILELRRENRYY